uniref:Uncharacterized protein n=1 Tax=Naja naja TaxID=35670 RepID=A0A8C6V853_NAJNA
MPQSYAFNGCITRNADSCQFWQPPIECLDLARRTALEAAKDCFQGCLCQQKQSLGRQCAALPISVFAGRGLQGDIPAENRPWESIFAGRTLGLKQFIHLTSK